MTTEDTIIERWRNPLFSGELEGSTHSGEEVNALCGDVIRYQLKLAPSGVIEEIRFTAHACVLTSALADMLAERMRGERPYVLDKIVMHDFVPGVSVGFNRRKCVELPKLALMCAIAGEVHGPEATT